MAPHCEIRFHDNPQGIFHGGQTMSGSVELRLDKPKLVNDFRLVILGCAEVQWTETEEKDKTEDKTVTYSGKEELLRVETHLIPRSIGNTEIPAGVNVYNFTCFIPPQVPTSFEGRFGKIRYTVQAILDRPWKFGQTSTVAFTVLKNLDLNEHLVTLKNRREVKLTKTFCCWPCQSRPLYIGVTIPVTGYVPGQKIPILVELKNTSSVPVTGVKSKLERKVSYISHTPRTKTREDHDSLAALVTTLSNDEPVQFTQELEIPSVAPTGNCSVLGIDYTLKVKVNVDGWHMNPIIRIPITIGTIPFAPSPTTFGPLTGAVTVPLTGALPRPNANQIGWTEDVQLLSPTAPELPDSDDILPPSYEQVMNGTAVNVNDNEPHAIGFQAFIPMYPVYKIDNSFK